MLDLCLLGTGGTMPLVNRWLTSLMVRYQGHCILIDCGEGTQIAAARAGVSLKNVETLLITHKHADHISGLPGILLSMSNMNKEAPLHIIGPVGIAKVVTALRCITPELPYPIEITELKEDWEQHSFYDCTINCYRFNHGINCYGYNIELARSGKFDPARAKERNIPLAYWGRLQKGEHIEENGQHYSPDMVLGAERKGLKLTYCTDSRPTENIIKAAAGSKLFICEGMYAEDDMLPKAIANKHMLFSEAAQIAKDAGEVEELWLTHFSPSLPNPKHFIENSRNIFPNSHTPRDGWKKELKFDD